MQRIALGLWLGASALAPSPAHAYGGFFGSQQKTIRQAGERVIFADNGDGTSTALIEVRYAGTAENFAWLLPISNVPQEGDLASAWELAFSRLEAATRPRFELGTRAEGTCESPGATGASAAHATFALRETCEDNPGLEGCAAPVPDGIEAFDSQVITADAGALDPDRRLLEPRAAVPDRLPSVSELQRICRCTAPQRRARCEPGLRGISALSSVLRGPGELLAR